MNETYDVAVVGATGAVGETMIAVLEERDFPIRNLYPLASSRSAGKQIRFRGDVAGDGQLANRRHVSRGVMALACSDAPTDRVMTGSSSLELQCIWVALIPPAPN